LKSDLISKQRARLVGVGVAAPTAIENGEPVIGDPGGESPRWREADLLSRIEETSGLTATIVNDATAACLSELEHDPKNRHRVMVYFYLSTLIGGGLVIDGNLLTGRTGNAGAVNALPLGLSSATRPNHPPQLIEATSLHTLEDIASERGIHISAFREEYESAAALNDTALACFEKWSDQAADALAFAAIAGTSFIEAEKIVIDGVLRRSLLKRLIASVEKKIRQYNLEGLIMPDICLGSRGFDARAVGAALLPLNEKFFAR
jgi:predicted NBD/HSP70 family sugar kinase